MGGRAGVEERAEELVWEGLGEDAWGEEPGWEGSE